MAAFYTLLYIADPADAVAVGCEEDAADRWPSLWLRHVGDLELVALWAALGNSASETEGTLMADLLFQASDEGPFVMRVPPAFVAALAAIPAERIPEVASMWGQTEELADWQPAELTTVIEQLREFARRAVTSGKPMLQVANL